MNKKVFFWSTFIVLFTIFSSTAQENSIRLDSILELRKESRDASIDLETRTQNAKKASELSQRLGVDTTVLASNINLAVLYFENFDYDKYVPQNKENLKLAVKLKDTTSMAIASFNLGTYYSYFLPADSAYFYLNKSLNFYDVLDDNYNKGIILYSIAILQDRQKDYLGSEENAVKALSIFLGLDDNFQATLYYIHSCYDLLGRIALKIDELEQSLQYHDKAIAIAERVNDVEDLIYYMNNKAFTLRKLGRFDESLDLYKKALTTPNLSTEFPESYALLIENIAYTKFVRGDENLDQIVKELLYARSLTDSFEDPQVRSFVSLDLSKVYHKQNKLDSAKIFAEESYELAQEAEDNEIILEALFMLGKTTKGQESDQYLYSHIRLSDSLLQLERSARNKFARVKFNTDQIEEENEKITEQRKWLLGISAGLLLTAVFIYIIVTQRAKNKELQFIQDQQKANEEIYNLMLSQQDKVDEARANEKKRISQEIHDGVLGRMFGVRLSLDSLNFQSGPESMKSRAQYINELKTIEEDMRKISHELNTDFVAGSGFLDILEELIKKQSTAYNLQYSFNCNDEIHWEEVSNKVKINLYRILQESLQNIYKHAGAEKVWIDISLKNNEIMMQIRDDGKGFDISKGKKGIGLKNINSRTADVGGAIKIDSIINHGTSVEFQVPYKDESNAES